MAEYPKTDYLGDLYFYSKALSCCKLLLVSCHENKEWLFDGLRLCFLSIILGPALVFVLIASILYPVFGTVVSLHQQCVIRLLTNKSYLLTFQRRFNSYIQKYVHQIFCCVIFIYQLSPSRQDMIDGSMCCVFQVAKQPLPSQLVWQNTCRNFDVKSLC